MTATIPGSGLVIPPTRYYCDLSPGTGWNNAARGYIAALCKLGMSRDTLRLHPTVTSDGRVDQADPLVPYTHGNWQGDNSADKIVITHLNAALLGNYPPVTYGERYNIAITTWETDSLPTRTHKPRFGDGPELSVVDDINAYDEIWVPLPHVRDVLITDGVNKPVYMIPHALLATPRTLPPPRDDKTVRFYTIGTWDERKDPETVVRAYLAIDWDRLVDMQVYSVPPSRDLSRIDAHSYKVHQRIKEIKSVMAEEGALAPPLGLHTVYVDYPEVVRRHLRGQVFVSASHGEGFCLPAWEAAACGSVVIGGGPWIDELRDVAGPTVFALPTRQVSVTPVEYTNMYELTQRWWTIDQADLQEAMQEAAEFTRASGAQEALVEASRRVRAHCGVDAIAREIAPRMAHVVEVLSRSGW